VVGSREIPFVDAHIHLWDLGRLRYPWLTPPFDNAGLVGSTEAIATNYLPAQYLADATRWNLMGAVHVDAGALPEDALAETEWLEAQADAGGLPDAIVAFAQLDDPDVEALLAAHARHPRVRGIRHIVNWHANPFYSYTPLELLTKPAWEQGFAALAHHGFSFDLQAYPGQLEAVARIAARNPQVSIVLNHCGMPLAREAEGAAEWRRNIAHIARQPQASIKISGFGILDHAWSVESIRPYVLEAIALFGPSRCMFASDFPTDKLYASFDRVMDAYATIVADFGIDDRRDLFGRTASRVYRLGLAI